jgi:hypothetical protein
MVQAAVGVAAGAVAVPMAFGGLAVVLLRALERSVGLAAPTADQAASEDLDSCALFRHLPQLRGKLAWRQLGGSL